MSSARRKLTPTAEAFFRVKRGLSGYVSYLSACGMTAAFSEYLLYEPILRILRSRGFSVQCEYECPGMPQPAVGDKKRIDFLAKRRELVFAVEVKWIRSKNPMLEGDFNKLIAVALTEDGTRSFLCLFGKQSDLTSLQMSPPPWAKVREYGKAIYADFRRTRYGCRIYEVQPD
jgi:hypothetical protein